MVLTKKTQLHLEALHERLVPSVTVLDLTTPGAVATAPSGAIVEQIDPQPTGSGTVQPFVRIQGKGIEQGYNTDARPLQFDQQSSLEFTHSITLGEVPVVSVNGQNYLEFFLGTNQKASSPDLSLDEVQIFLGNVGNLSDYKAGTLGGMSPVFDINSGGAVSVKLNGDMALLVPDAAFAGASPNTYVYLYSKFGAQPGEGANGGFEQWWLPPAPPAPTGASISGSVIQTGTNLPISGLTIQLSGMDTLGNLINLTTITGANGDYSFTNLPAGTYFITEVQTNTHFVVGELFGTVNNIPYGMLDVPNASFDYVTVPTGGVGANYVFIDT